MIELEIEVGWTSTRPIVPDEHRARVRIGCDDTFAGVAMARTDAANLVKTIRHDVCEMVTSTEVLSWTD